MLVYVRNLWGGGLRCGTLQNSNLKKSTFLVLQRFDSLKNRTNFLEMLCLLTMKNLSPSMDFTLPYKFQQFLTEMKFSLPII